MKLFRSSPFICFLVASALQDLIFSCCAVLAFEAPFELLFRQLLMKALRSLL